MAPLLQLPIVMGQSGLARKNRGRKLAAATANVYFLTG
jgi:hypothetical protein